MLHARPSISAVVPAHSGGGEGEVGGGGELQCKRDKEDHVAGQPDPLEDKQPEACDGREGGDAVAKRKRLQRHL
jgi:hypothetical protein